ncbi:hypothetical protein LguiA_012998 [Lonicera macranthoides]
MEKGLQLTSELQKCNRRRCNSKDVYLADRISNLPDKIHETILSRLRMRKVVRTCVLSGRWKGLCTFITGCLDFDFGILINDIDQSEILELERVRYKSTVNKIVKCKGATIDTFKVEFDVQLSHKSDIDSWVNFALRKRVQNLELKLELADLVNVFTIWNNYYLFSAQSLGYSNISFLTSLNLDCVNMTGEVLEYFLSDCPFLEFLRTFPICPMYHSAVFTLYLVQRFHELPIALSQIEKLQLSLCIPVVPLVKECEAIRVEIEYKHLTITFDWKGKPEEREVQQRENCSMHKCLEVLELVWFRGSTTDVELATYLLSSAPFLNKIIIDTRNPDLLLGTTSGRFGEEENVSAKECVRLLTEQLSPGAELLTL